MEQIIIKSAQMIGKTTIRCSDIEALFDNAPLYSKRVNRGVRTLTEYYTTKEVREKYDVSFSAVFSKGNRYNIPRVLINGNTCWSKKVIDKYFSSQKTDFIREDWNTTKEMVYDNDLASDYSVEFRRLFESDNHHRWCHRDVTDNHY